MKDCRFRTIDHFNRSKFRCINNIPCVVDLYPVVKQEKQLTLTSLALSGTISNSTASLKYTQVFENTLEAPIECIYKFPSDIFFAITALQVKVGDKLIEAKVMRKQEAKEKYDDSMAAGHTAVKMNYDEKIPDIIELNIGQLQPGASATITVHMISQLEVIENGFYTFVFPLEFIPRYGATEKVKGESGSHVPAKFSMDLQLEATSDISDLHVNHKQIKYEKSENGLSVSIKLEESESVEAKDIVVGYSTANIREPQIMLSKSAKYPGEIAAHISFIPRSSEEPERNGDEEMKSGEESDEENDDQDVASGEFVFILDRSGSMAGSLMRVAKEALCLFIRSLPPDSKFNVISFGSTYECMFEDSVKYNNENLDKALKNIDKFTSDLGGTELYEPIEYALKTAPDHQYPRAVFVLTDGSISNTETVLKKIAEFNHQTRVHSFGIGSGASKYLVNEIAKQGLGSSTLVDGSDPHLKSKVIRALKIASKPAFTNISVDWSSNSESVKFVSPEPPKIPNVYEEEPFHIFAILDEAKLVEGTLSVTLFNTSEQTEDTIMVQVDPSKITESADGHNFQLAAKNRMEFMNRFSKEDAKAKDEEITELSVKYSVLCDKTAFFGKIKNKDKSDAEMETIEVSIKKHSVPIQGSSLLRGGHMMNMCARSYATVDQSRVFHAKVKTSKKSGGMFSGIANAIGGLFSSKEEGQVLSAQRNRKAAPEVMRCAAPAQDMCFASSQGVMRSADIYDEASSGSDKSQIEDEDDCDEIQTNSIPASFIERKADSKPIFKEKKEEAKPINQDYMEIVQYQDTTGFFSGLPSKYSSVESIEVPISIKDQIENESELKQIWTTILAICILKKHFKDSKGEWTMMVKKAEAFLKSKHLKNYKGEINDAMTHV